MTVEQFVRMLNTNYGCVNEWPREMIVDSDTYANCCQVVINANANADQKFGPLIWKSATIRLGPHNGLMFKNVELILKSEK